MADGETIEALRARLAERDSELAALRTRVGELETYRQALDALMAFVPESITLAGAPGGPVPGERERLLASLQGLPADEQSEQQAEKLDVAGDQLDALTRTFRTQKDALHAASLALHLAEERWRAVVDSLPDPVIVYDAAGRATFFNTAIDERDGRPLRGEAPLAQQAARYGLERPDGRQIGPGELPVEQALARDAPVVDVEIVWHREDGQRRIGVWNAAPLHDEEGHVIGAMAIGHDVTEERRAAAERERLLDENQHQRELLARIIETMPSGIAVLEGRQLQVKQINLAFRQFLDEPLRDADLEGLALQELLPHAEASGLAEILRGVAASHQQYFNPEYEHQGFRPQAIYWRFWALPLATSEVDRPDVLMLALEITEQVLARRKVEALAAEIGHQRQMLDEILSVSPDHFYVYDRAGQYLYANRAAARSLGMEQQQIVGKTRHELGGPASVMTAFDTHHEELFSTGRTCRGETEIELVDGVRHYEYILSPVQSEMVVATVRDITRHRQIEQSLRETLARLTQRETELRQARDDLEERVQERTAQLQFLHRVDQGILAAQAPDRIAQVAVDHIGRAVPCTRAAVLLFEGEIERACMLASSSDIGGLVAIGDWIDFADWRLMPNLMRGEVGVVEDLSSLTDLNRIEQAMLEEGSRSYFSMPLLAGGQTIGGITVWYAATGAPPAEHVTILRQIADSLAVAIQNARLFEQVQANRRQSRAFSRELVEAVENERRTIARELHDEAGQALTALSIGLSLLRKHSADAGLVRSRIDELDQTVQGVQEGLHRIAINLRPPSLDRFGLLPAITQYVESFRSQTGLEVDLVTSGFEGLRLDPAIETALYRVVQEALTNVARHAVAGRVGVVLQRGSHRVTAIVEDDGVGFDAASALRSSRLGLVGMRERAEMLGGSLSIESQPDHGTTIFVDVPLEKPNSASL